jgi:hypothetical protein
VVVDPLAWVLQPQPAWGGATLWALQRDTAERADALLLGGMH